MNGVVDNAADLTAAWLSEALGTDVRSVVHERIGSGVTGAAYRLALDRDGGPDTLVAKIAAGDEEARYRVRNGYRAEVGFYVDLAETVDIRTPRCWHAAIDDDGTRFTLLLEDLAPRAPGVQAAGCSLEQADDAVRNLAGLHAPRWDDDSLFDLAFLQRPTDDRAAFLSELASSATDAFVERYETELDADDVATLRAAADVMEHWLRSPPEHFAPIHGDYRLDNLMFPPHGGGRRRRRLADALGRAAARDLAYFLATSVDVAHRRAAEHDLVAGYHAELVARGVDGYPLDRCFDDYRLGQLQAPLITTIGCMYATAERSEEADRMFLAMARRSCAAIRDLDALDAVAAVETGSMDVGCGGDRGGQDGPRRISPRAHRP